VLETVRRLRASLTQVEAIRDLAKYYEARREAVALRPRVEATGYGPLIAELLELIGVLENQNAGDPKMIEETLHQALFTALAARDDATAARAAADLIHVEGALFQRPEGAEMWFRLSESILDRLGPGNERTRAWAAHNFAFVLGIGGHLERAEQFARAAIALKTRALGADHPDTVISLNLLSNVLMEREKPAEALATANSAIEILGKSGDPDSESIGDLQHTKGNALVDLGRGAEAEACFAVTLGIYRARFGPSGRSTAYPLIGLGEARVVQGRPATAVAFLESALRIQDTEELIPFNRAETQFWLARALWDSGRDRRRAVMLAREAHKTLATHESPRRERAVVQWLAAHNLPSR
jgi:tetratricopeptide (TPR) repeat protein